MGHDLKRLCPIPSAMLDSACVDALLAAAQPGLGNSDDDQLRLGLYGDFYVQGDSGVQLGISMTWAHDLPATDTFHPEFQPANGASAAKFDSLGVDALNLDLCNLFEGDTLSVDVTPTEFPPGVQFS